MQIDMLQVRPATAGRKVLDEVLSKANINVGLN